MKTVRLSNRSQLIGITLLSAVITVGIGLGGQYLFDLSAPKQVGVISATHPPATHPPVPSPSSSSDKAVEADPPKSTQRQQPADITDDLPPRRQPPPITAATSFGHLAYPEAPQTDLVSIGTYGEGSYQRTEFLVQEVAAAFGRMQSAAAAEGVRLSPISGFRSIADQRQLFDRQIQRQGSAAAAAQLSAPPGHSEHHTGYAIDIGDGLNPQTDVKLAFESTNAYRWLKAHAREYGFELSFPRHNLQGVSFEPWHWRYVGSGKAVTLFGATSDF